jgi:hypothetical protein
MTRIWVADTSAILQVRRCVTGDPRTKHSTQKAVFLALRKMVNEGRLVFPRETYAELKAGNDKHPDPAQDVCFKFARDCKDVACRKASFDIVRELGEHDLVRYVTDPDSEDDEADVYVLAVALELQREGNEVGVLTQERNDTARKISLNTACGTLGLVCLRMEALLHQERILVWSR